VLQAKPDSLSDVVYETIRDAIVNRTLPPGFRVTEAEVASRLNVSKTPVREALLSFRKLGLIEPSGRRGWHIVVPSEELIREAYETRQGLEMFAAELAATRSPDGVREQILGHAQRCLSAAEAGDLEGFRRWFISRSAPQRARSRVTSRRPYRSSRSFNWTAASGNDG
jgi:DNA-binding GntR family transcriptional regulator